MVRIRGKERMSSSSRRDENTKGECVCGGGGGGLGGEPLEVRESIFREHWRQHNTVLFQVVWHAQYLQEGGD